MSRSFTRSYKPSTLPIRFTKPGPKGKVYRGVRFDAVTKSANFTTTPDPFTIDHTPVSSEVKGLIVMIANRVTITDGIPDGNVTYGGTNVPRINRTQVNSGDENGSVYTFFLGQSIPQGTQTLSVNHNAANTGKVIWIVTVTADTPTTAVVDSDGLGQVGADPQLTLNFGSKRGIPFAVIFSGHDDLASLTPLSEQTEYTTHDHGVSTAHTLQGPNDTTGNYTVGWTGTSEDYAISALAVIDVPVVTAGQIFYKTGGAFVQKPVMQKTGGAFDDGSIAVKDGGSF